MAALTGGVAAQSDAQQRALGLDVSRWQGTISQTTWNNIYGENREFVFIRSSRGGTTGVDKRRGGYPSTDNTYYELSQRYDDPVFIQNMVRATNAGLFAGPYHYGRHDIIATTTRSGGIANSGTDEANHYMQMAGPYMRPGYLLPVFDLEDAQTRTDQQVAQFCLDFSNRVYEVMGVHTAMYINGNYAHNVLAHETTPATRDQLAKPAAKTPSMISPAYPMLWTARWPAGSGNQYFGDVQSEHPKDTYEPIYGPWDDYGTTHPWHFWQYASGGRLQSFNNGNSNLDFNVSQGDIEFVKNQLVPAVWMNDNSGDWGALANWNSGQPVTAPPLMPGQLTPELTGPLPTPRLPGTAGTGPAVTSGVHDTVILERPNADITVTLSSGAYQIRKLYMRETLNITGGALTINYDPTYRPDSSANVLHAGPISAQFSGAVTLSGGSLNAHTVLVDAGRTFTLSGGALSFNTINLTRGTTPARIAVGGSVTYSGLNGATATIKSTGSGTNASVDLLDGTRSFIVQGIAQTDLAINVPITNGGLTKEGSGTMQLGAANTYTGLTTVAGGILRLTAANNLSSSTAVQTTVTGSLGGTLQLSNNISVNRPLTIGGTGRDGASSAAPGNMGALDNLSGVNTWAGTITLDGTGSSSSSAGLNLIGASAGTLVLSGVIQSGLGGSWAKTGDGDVVLTGDSPNTYTHLTRVAGGRLIIEKDGAFGAAGSAIAATGNTYQLAGSSSTIAFRAPGASGGFAYNTYEWLNLEGNGAPGFGQLDNLGGNNTFAGEIGLNGPSGVASIGVAAGSLDLSGGIWTYGAAGARTLNKIGPGTLIISGNSSGLPTNIINNGAITDGTVNVSAGVLETRSPGATVTNHPGMTTWNVAGGATLRIGSGTLATTNVTVSSGGLLEMPAGGGAKTLRVASLTPDGRVDVGDHKAIVDYTTTSPIGTWNGTAYSGLTKNIIDGRNGGAWDGNGIVTSMADAQGGFQTTVGITEASQALGLMPGMTGMWRGQLVDATTVLIAYAYQGDADLSGAIDPDDFFHIDSGYLAGGSGFGRGDFNYDGRIDADDYFIINSNYGQQYPQLSGAAALEGVASVPEPGAAVALGLLAASLLRRRRG